MGKEPCLKEWRLPLEVGKGKEVDPFLEFSEGIQSCWYLNVSHIRFVLELTSITENNKCVLL